MADGSQISLIRKPGIYDLDMDTYHSQCCDGPSISSGGLRKIENESPKHFWWQAHGLNPKAPAPEIKAHFEFGKAVHALLFDDKEEIGRLIVSPFDSYRTNAAKDWKAAQHEAGRTIVTESDMDAIKEMHHALATENGVPELLTAGDPEKSMIYRDTETGIWVKSRPDRIPTDGVLADLKTCASADPRILNAEIVKRGYHMQMALAAGAMKILLRQDVTDAWLVFVEKTPPYAVTTVRIGDELMDLGARQCRRALRKFADCLKDNDWPAYCEGPISLHGPKWFTEKLNEELEANQL